MPPKSSEEVIYALGSERWKPGVRNRIIICIFAGTTGCNMLEFKDVTLERSGRVVFEHLSFMLGEGKSLFVTGESGTGKTALLQAILGFGPVESGYITIDGEPVTRLSAPYFRQQIAFVPQAMDFPHGRMADLITEITGLKAGRSTAFSVKNLFQEWAEIGLERAVYDTSPDVLPLEEAQLALLSALRQLHRPLLLVDNVASDRVAQYAKQMAEEGACVVLTSRNAWLGTAFDKRISMERKEEKQE